MKTALYDKHVALGAKIIEFAGWEMPVQYKGIIPEHHAVRTQAGIFDVSHMGRISVSGKDAERFLESLSTNKLSGKADFSSTYTVFPNQLGGSVDDLIVYKQNQTQFFIIVNASNRSKDLKHLKQYALPFEVQVQDHYQEEGIIAVQGPKAIEIGSRLFPELALLKSAHFAELTYNKQPLFLSKTGYTGAGGFEIYAPTAVIVDLWERFLKEGIEPIGLGARDTLRLEMGYALYGHELNDTIAPNESVSAWTIKWNKGDFLGKEAMLALEKSPQKRSEYGIILLDKGIAREGCEIFKEGMSVGKVTSGSHSPTLNKSIAIILASSSLKNDELVEVQIRQNRVKAQIAAFPFVKN